MTAGKYVKHLTLVEHVLHPRKQRDAIFSQAHRLHRAPLCRESRLLKAQSMDRLVREVTAHRKA